VSLQSVGPPNAETAELLERIPPEHDNVRLGRLGAMTIRKRHPFLVVVFLVLLGACGGDNGSTGISD